MFVEVDLSATWQVESGELQDTVHVTCLRSLPRGIRPLVLSRREGGGSCEVTVSFELHHCLVSSVTVWSSAKTVEIYGKPWNGRDSEYMCTLKGSPLSTSSKQLIDWNKQDDSALHILENSNLQTLSGQGSEVKLSLDFSDASKEEQEINTSLTDSDQDCRKTLSSEFSESDKDQQSDILQTPPFDENDKRRSVNLEFSDTSTKHEINTKQPDSEQNDKVKVLLNVSDPSLTTKKQSQQNTEKSDVPKQELPKELSPSNLETNEDGASVIIEDPTKRKSEEKSDVSLFQNTLYEAKSKLSRIDPWSQTTIKLLSLDGDKTKVQILSIHLEVTRGPPKSALPFTPLPPLVNFRQNPNASSNPLFNLNPNPNLEMKPGLLNDRGKLQSEIGKHLLGNNSLSSFLPLLSQSPNLTMSNLSSFLSSSQYGGKGEVGALSDAFAAIQSKGGGGGGIQMEQISKIAEHFLKYGGEKGEEGERRERTFSGAFMKAGFQNGTLLSEGEREGTTEDRGKEVAKLKFEETQVKIRKDEDGKKSKEEETESFAHFSEEMLIGLEKVYRKLERLESVCERIENRMESNLKAMDSRIQLLEHHVRIGNSKGGTTEDNQKA